MNDNLEASSAVDLLTARGEYRRAKKKREAWYKERESQTLEECNTCVIILRSE